MKKVSKFLLNIDSFGRSISIYYRKKQIYKTIFGGVITMFVWGFCAVLCYFFGSQLVNKTNPQVISSERYVQQGKRINITNDNIIFMFGLNNVNSTFYLDPTLFTFRAVQIIKQSFINNQTGEPAIKLTPYNLTMKVCDMSDVGIPDMYNYFNNLDVSLMYCFSQNQNIYMEGDYDSEKFAQVYVYIEKCQNGTSNVVCKPKEIINQELSQTYLSFYLTNVLVDPSNYKIPFQHQGMNLYTSTSSSFPKEFQVFFTNEYLQDDIGLIFNDVVEHHTFVFTNYQETTFFGDEQTIVRILLRIQKQKENLVLRRYQKIQDIVPQIIGLLKLVTFGLSLIANPVINIQMFQDLGENLFENDQPKTISRNQAKIVNQIKQKLNQNKYFTEGKKCNNNYGEDEDEQQFSINPSVSHKEVSPKKLKQISDQEFQQIKYRQSKRFSSYRQNSTEYPKIFPPRTQLRKISFDNDEMASQKQLSINGNEIVAEQEFKTLQSRIAKQKLSNQQNFEDHPNKPIFSPKTKLKKDVDTFNFILYSPSNKDKKISNNQECLFQQISSRSEQQQSQQNNFSRKENYIDEEEYTENDLQQENAQNSVNQENFEIPKTKNVKKKNKFEFSFKDYLALIFCNKKLINHNADKMKYGIKSIQKQLDIIYIINKLQEIDKLKSVIFNEDQLKLFNNISKPILQSNKKLNLKSQNNTIKTTFQESTVLINSIYQFTKEHKLKSNTKNTDEEKLQLENLQALQNLLQKQKISQIDKRLIEFNSENLNIESVQSQTS